MDFLKNLGGGGHNTMKYTKNAPEGSKRFELHKKLEATLGSGDLRSAVKLPPDEELEEWLAVNVIDFFNQVNLLYGSINEYCTEKSCPIMSAGPKYEYYWQGKNDKKPIKLSATKYVDSLMTWIQELLEDDKVFPVSEDQSFPKDFKEIVKNIFRRLFRVYAHMYYSHAQEVISLEVEAHLNTGFKHFYLFSKEFDLIPVKEMSPLEHIIKKIEG